MSTAINIQKPARRDLIVTFVTGHPKAILLLRSARKIAQEIGGQWRVVYVETPDDQKQPAHYQQVLNLLSRAKQMGGETEHLHALNLFKGVEEFLGRDGAAIHTVIIGSTEPEGRFLGRLRAPQWLKLVQLASKYTRVETLPLAGLFMERLERRVLGRLRTISLVHLAYGLLSVVFPFSIALLLQSLMPPALFRINEQNIDNLFLITAAIVGGRFGILPGIMAAIAGFFVNNVYYTLPYHQLKLSSASDWFSMSLFLAGAILISMFTSQMRQYAHRLKKREAYSEMLFALYRRASESFSREQAIATLEGNLEQMLGAKAAFFVPSAINPLVLEAISPLDLELSEADRKALEICWREMKCTGLASPYDPGTTWRFEPMICAGGEVGVLGAKVQKAGQMDVWFGRLLTAAADQSATILAHIELENSMEAGRIVQEREKLRIMLLSSVSHDLKTPLAGIIGGLSACQTLAGRLKPEQQKELIAGALDEARRLDSFITNILDMTKLETGNITFSSDWHNIKNVTTHVVSRLSHRIKQRQIVLAYPAQEVQVYMDDVMTSQVLQNLIDNACKYTGDNSAIEITWEHLGEGIGEGIVCHVRDHGPGIPQEKLLSVFDKYSRIEKQDMQVAGTGLGLAISKAIIETQGGWIKAANHPSGGAVFTFYLPQRRPHKALELVREKNHATLA
jgi:two-component system, OmpR family, sensor histidine kinase KdpD